MIPGYYWLGSLYDGEAVKQMVDVKSAHFLHHHHSRLVSKWISGLITQLLQVSHFQWIYRCILVHDRSTGTLVLGCFAPVLAAYKDSNWLNWAR